jgi:hypothetical protein
MASSAALPSFTALDAHVRLIANEVEVVILGGVLRDTGPPGTRRREAVLWEESFIEGLKGFA